MTLELGKKPVEDVGTRDAVHVPIVVGIAGEQICGGGAIQIESDEKWYRAGSVGRGLIADPFATVIEAGDKFLVCFPPGKVLDVRHVWTHPAVDGPSVMSKNWMEKWIEENHISLHPEDREKTTPYVWWMTQLNEIAAGERTNVTFWGDDCELRQRLNHCESAEWAKICYHYTRITGRDLDPEGGPFFSCTC